jgi:peptidoglycan hydrolase-like protein with peptidoglycan-binding domain
MAVNLALHEGDYGALVRQLQVFLCAHGHTTLIIDGIFDSRIKNAVLEFQRSHRLEMTGVVNQDTWNALRVLSPIEAVETIQELKQGDTGEAVCQLQVLLRSHYSNVIIDGIFNAKITKLVKHFQAKCELENTGYVDAKTWQALLSKIIRLGDTGEAVRDVQTQLQIHGYNLCADGMFGEATTTAVMDFQQKHGLPIDGLVGLMTWVVLMEAMPPAQNSIQLAEVCKTYNSPHQLKALEWLQHHIPAPVLNEFTTRWCNS